MQTTTTFGTSTEVTGPEPLTKPLPVIQCPYCVFKDTLGVIVQTREHWVCQSCGTVLDLILEKDNVIKKRTKHYKFYHHYSERIAALTCTGPPITDEKFMERLREMIRFEDGKPISKYRYGPVLFAKLIKKIDKRYKTDYTRKKYHERFVWIRDRLGIEKKPIVTSYVVTALKARYEAVYKAFQRFKKNPKLRPFLKPRKNIININYLTCQFLKQEKQMHLIRYFSNIKGRKTNFKSLKMYWYLIKKHLSKFTVFVDENHVTHHMTWNEEDITEKEIDQRMNYQ